MTSSVRSSDLQAPYRLRLPGPTAVPQRVLQATAGPVVDHRGAEFRTLLGDLETLVRPLFGTTNPVLFFAASGTGMMEAALVNVLAPGERLLVAVNGQFGERFAEIGRALGAVVDVIEVPWDKPVTAADVAPWLSRASYRALAVVHNESSTGMVADLPGIGALLREHDTLLVVDSISGLGGLELRQDEWGLDVVISGSQKALMCPPGGGLATVSDKARAVIDRDDRMPRYYWDFRTALVAAAKVETSFTAPVSLLAGMREALTMIHEEGYANTLARHRRLAGALRTGCAALGLAPFGEPSAWSSTVVVAHVPEPLKGGDLVRYLNEHHRTAIAGARNRLQDRVVRIGTMGQIDAGTILTDLLYLEEALVALGVPVTRGAGVAAATRYLVEEATA